MYTIEMEEIMKKKLILCLTAGILAAVVLGGCGSQNTIERTQSEMEAEKEENAGKEEIEEEHTEKKDAEEEETKETDSYAYPVLGEEDIEDYDGFAYLQWERLTSGSGEEVDLYVPMDEDAYKSDDNISGYYMGISYSVELDPLIRTDEEDYRVNENLDYYLETIYDPEFNADYYDVVISDAERIDKDTAYAFAEYCKYYDYDNTYCAVFATYLLKRLDNDVTVLVELKVNSDDADDETEDLIDELETFYQCEVDWSARRAEEKIEELGGSAGVDGSGAFGGSLAFDIPEEWGRDEAESDSDIYVYAPYGDAELADCLVSISREYTGMDESELDILRNNQGFLLEMAEAQLSDDDSFDGDVSIYEGTNQGVAVKAAMASEGEDGITTEIHVYFIFTEEYAYIISAAQHGDAPMDDPFAVAEGIMKSIHIVE